ncbi:MAG: cysteine--tRNA ligase [Gemmatimonadales bacterium]
MPLRLHNTLTRTVELFEPQTAGRVSLYACGPTVRGYAHIGNFRTFLTVDLLRRWLAASGYQVFHVMNLTDVDDRTIQDALSAGKTLDSHVQQFIDAFYADRDFLRIQPADAYPRATGYIDHMITLIEGLLEKGVAYRGEDGSVYFAIDRFPDYGRLSQLDRRELKAGASQRVSSDEYAKEDARDFVLWKAAKEEDEQVGAAWDAPFGRGRPGWHLECSTMALHEIREQYDATVLDIHVGGVDLIFPHHEDEIAQSCAYTGEKYFARYWVHGEFLNVRGTKMSKRFGNITTARDLQEDGWDAGAIRLLIYQTHYRQQLDLTDEALEGAAKGARRLGEFGRRLLGGGSEGSGGSGGSSESAGFVEAAAKLRADFAEAMDDDLNAPRALAAVFDFVSEGNRLLDAGEVAGPEARDAWALADGVLDASTESRTLEVRDDAHFREDAGVIKRPGGDSPPADPVQAEEWAFLWATERSKAKKNKNFAEADRIRDLLSGAGFEVRDTPQGPEIIKR